MPDDQNPPNMYNKLIFTILFNILFFSVLTASIKDIYLLPQPRQILFNNQKFPIGKIQLSTPVLAEELDSLFRECGGRIVPKASLNVVVRITDSLPDINLNPEEGYTLSVTRNRIYIQATTSTGVYRAMLYNHRLARFPYPGLYARCRQELHFRRRTETGNCDARPIQNQCLSLASYRKSGLAT